MPWQQILVYIEAIVRVYNRYGRRDNMYKARIKILVKAEGQTFFDQVNAEFNDILTRDVDGAAHIIPQAEFDRVAASFCVPESVKAYAAAGNGLPTDATEAEKNPIQQVAAAQRGRPTRFRATRPCTCRSSAWAKPQAT